MYTITIQNKSLSEWSAWLQRQLVKRPIPAAFMEHPEIYQLLKAFKELIDKVEALKELSDFVKR